MRTRPDARTIEAARELKDAGAKYEDRDDGLGGTRTGWYLDGVYLARAVLDAVNAMKGN
jgi:hypothetical protein